MAFAGIFGPLQDAIAAITGGRPPAQPRNEDVIRPPGFDSGSLDPDGGGGELELTEEEKEAIAQALLDQAGHGEDPPSGDGDKPSGEDQGADREGTDAPKPSDDMEKPTPDIDMEIDMTLDPHQPPNIVIFAPPIPEEDPTQSVADEGLLSSPLLPIAVAVGGLVIIAVLMSRSRAPDFPDV